MLFRKGSLRKFVEASQEGFCARCSFFLNSSFFIVFYRLIAFSSGPWWEIVWRGRNPSRPVNSMMFFITTILQQKFFRKSRKSSFLCVWCVAFCLRVFSFVRDRNVMMMWNWNPRKFSHTHGLWHVSQETLYTAHLDFVTYERFSALGSFHDKTDTDGDFQQFRELHIGLNTSILQICLTESCVERVILWRSWSQKYGT